MGQLEVRVHMAHKRVSKSIATFLVFNLLYVQTATLYAPIARAQDSAGNLSAAGSMRILPGSSPVVSQPAAPAKATGETALDRLKASSAQKAANPVANVTQAQSGKWGLSSLTNLIKKPGISSIPGLGSIGTTYGNINLSQLGGQNATNFLGLASNALPGNVGGLSNMLIRNSSIGGFLNDQANGIPGWVFGAGMLALTWKDVLQDIMKLPPYLAALWGAWGTWMIVTNRVLSNPTRNTKGNPLFRTSTSSQFLRYPGGSPEDEKFGSSLSRGEGGPLFANNLVALPTGVAASSSGAKSLDDEVLQGRALQVDINALNAVFSYSASSSGQSDAGTTGMSRVDLSLDDEIDKATMPIFLPKRVLERSFASDMVSRDSHLNLFETARGVAILTLSYLDKTVAAGLATVQQQSDMDYLGQLTKQISWMNAKIANPSQALLYEDVDEKFQICMGPGSEAFDVRKQCKDALVDGQPLCPAELYENKAMFSFCLCCAEQSLSVNYSTVEPRPHTFEGFSVVDRAFLGKRMPVTAASRGSNSPQVSDIGMSMLEVSRFFRVIYGDVVMYNSEIEKSRGIAKRATLKIKSLPPLLDLPQFLAAIRNLDEFRDTPELAATKKRGMKYASTIPWAKYVKSTFLEDKESCDTDIFPDFPVPYCSVSGIYQWGICPSLRELVRASREGGIKKFMTTNKQRYDDLQNEVATGSPLTGKMLQEIANIGNDSEREAVIEKKCNNLTLEAFSKLHEQILRISDDALTANRSLSEPNRSEVRRLLARVSDQFRSGLVAGRKVGSLFDAEFAQSMAVNQTIEQQGLLGAQLGGAGNPSAVTFGGGASPGK